MQYRFRIDAFTPESLPMGRLAAYLSELAIVMGEPAQVVFKAIEKGSAVLVSEVAHEAVPKVRARVATLRDGGAPKEARRAADRLNDLLRQDNASGALHEGKRRGALLSFAGARARLRPVTIVRQHGSLQGKVVRVGGTDDTIPVHLMVEGSMVPKVHTTPHLAKRLAAHLFDVVRIHGEGRWARSPDGVWALEEFAITTFEPLEAATLGETVRALRALDVRFEYHEDVAPRRGG